MNQRREARQDDAVELAQVAVAGGVANRTALMQPPPHEQRRRVVVAIGGVGDVADAVETGEDERKGDAGVTAAVRSNASMSVAACVE